MKKLMMMAMVAATMVGAAQAGEKYNYNYVVYLPPYATKDTTPGNDHVSWYKCYGMTQDTAKSLLKTSEAVDYNDVADWLAKDFEGNSAAVVDESQALTTSTGYGWGTYNFEKYDLSDFSGYRSDYIGVFLFDNGTDKAYNVFGAPDGAKCFVFSNMGPRPSATGWKEPPPPDYLTFTAEEDGSTVTFKWLSANWVSNSTDGVTWNAYTKGTTNTLAKVGDKVMFKGNGVVTGSDASSTLRNFSMTGKIAASGDVGTLTDGKGGADVKLTQRCYLGMFCNCTSLTTAPDLPATTLNTYCYYQMFKGCTSLTTAPVLPATTLAYYCYFDMFQGCTLLTMAPVLPATTLADRCYQAMFSGCTALKVNQEGPGTAWSIPDEATEAKTWNGNMFLYNRGTIPVAPSKGVTYYVVPTVAFKPIEVENATWEIIEDNQVMTLRDKVHTNGTIKVRYTAKDGLAFDDGSYVKTVYVGKADADPFAPTGYAPAAPKEWTQATASTTVDIDTRTDKTYFDADDILPVWAGADRSVSVTSTNTTLAAKTKAIAELFSTTNWFGWKPAYLGKYTLTKTEIVEISKPDGSSENTNIVETADITYTTPVYVSTNAALDVAGATWALVDAGGSPITEMDDQGRFIVPTNSQLKVVYTVTKDGYYFKDGKTTYEAAFTATGAEEFDAATMIGEAKPKAGDIGTPKVQLGIVAQRYPWDGCLDVQYKATFVPEGVYALEVKVKVEGEERTQTFPGAKSGISTVVFDAKENFGEVKTKNCKVTAKLVKE